ncbi:MAG: 50S ribosome-binding GTPase, partial [Clostridia bacterium]|nr:50S ribosome-binding GTPase [Clostridia bacterium]
MARPLVAIVGRPNVGKSTFFNKIAGRRIAIVEDTPGVTRDRVYADCEWQNVEFTLIDTGGIDPQSTDPLLVQMRMQAEIAIDTCDVILFFVDGKQGLTSDDDNVADMLRRSGKPVILVVNKIDNVSKMSDIYEFYQLGIGDPIGVSSVNMLNFGDLLDRICEYLPEEKSPGEEQDAAISVAVVGKPNVGKSSIVNRLL